MERYFYFAGVALTLDIPDTMSFAHAQALEGFQSAPEADSHRFSFRKAERLSPPRGELIAQNSGCRVYGDGSCSVRYIGTVHRSWEDAYIRVAHCGREHEVQLRADQYGDGIGSHTVLSALGAEHLIIRAGAVLLHASFIEHAGKAILFTAPSETGKSTQAQLWCDHMGAELVNGDRAAVRIMDGQVFACGIPFSGSSPVRRNVTLPLAAIVYLSQAPENAIQRLRGVRAFRRVWEGCTVNVWDREDVELATKTVGDVVSRVPIYHLACTPDVRAAELLNQTMEVEK